MEDVFRVRRVYDDADPADRDGPRVLVDRLWPRGISRERAAVDDWFKDVAPSAELRSWYHRDTSRYEEFAARYRKELDDPGHRPVVEALLSLAAAGERPVTLVTAVKDVEHSHLPTLLRRLGQVRRPGTR
ncbi:DUF488 domain-containing protein [Streptomyces paludis]|uniref:DUF488 family protein n=1 Tax=Streptomyces paludis TaxID=2282738 RepID=A0A345HXW8_9ACTN|nr:DUF488 family protein [Streptomyces paludis]AXG81542.1 DUF488 family protein [Streptomyces paludis]